MPKPLHELNPFSFAELRKFVRIKTGFPIQTKPECEKLADLIHANTSIHISSSTIFRIFISNEDSKPYVNTLNGLSAFCGFKDWYDFENYVNEIEKFDFSYGKIFLKDKSVDSLLKLCIHNNQYDLLLDYTRQFPENLNYDKKIRIGYEFYNSLLNNPNSNSDFFEKFNSLPLIRESFFELMADPDFQVKDYEYGLNCYSENLKPFEKKKDFQDWIFANSLLYRHYYLSKQLEKASEIGELLYNDSKIKDDSIDELFIFPKIRYLSYKIWYFDLMNLEKEKINHIIFLLEYSNQNILFWSYYEQRIAFYNIAEVFLNSNIDTVTVDSLKQIFKSTLSNLPNHIINKSLDKILPYMQENAVLKLKYLGIK